MKKILLIVLMLVTSLITGCWDMIEVNQRIFPYTAAIDINHGAEDKLSITYTYPNINALGKNPTQDEKIFAITETTNSLFEGIHNLGSKIRYPFYLRLLKVIILSEEVALNEDIIRQIVDGVNRDYILNKKIQLTVVKGSSKSFMISGLKYIRQESDEGPLYGLLINEQNSTNFTPKPVADFIRDMDTSNASIVPLSISHEDEQEVSGGAVFKGYKLVGYIDHIQNTAITILNNHAKEEFLQTKFKDDFITVLGTNFKTKRKLIEDKENISVLFSVEVEGQLQEYILTDEVTIDTVEVIEGMEKALEDKLKMDLEMAIEKMQDGYKADVLHIGDYLRKFHTKVWKQVEGDWDKIFPEIKILVEVDVKLRRRGLTI